MSLPRALSKLGACSRSQAFAVIASGRVTVNGTQAKDPTARVDLSVAQVSVDGVSYEDTRVPMVLALHKPPGYVTTRSDPQGRPTVYDLIPKFDRFLFPVGRLDRDTSGLLIFTDDHRLGERLTSPDHEAPKTYHVCVNRSPGAQELDALRTGLDIGRGEFTRPAKVEVLGNTPNGVWLELTLREGRNRQIRRMCAAVSLDVLALVRVRIGSFDLGDLPSGEWRKLTAAEVRSLDEPPTPRRGKIRFPVS